MAYFGIKLDIQSCISNQIYNLSASSEIMFNLSANMLMLIHWWM